MKSKTPAEKPQRIVTVDILRGIAILMMFIFHFSYDLNLFGYVEINFLKDPFWANFRSLIVSSFLLLIGISIILTDRKKFNLQRFNYRMAKILTYALLVTLGSYIMFPESFIYFGILHFIIAASILGLLFRKFYWLNLILGISLLLLDTLYSNPIFDNPLINWIGFTTRLPYTEDYVPLIPWFGVVLIGMFIGRAVFLNTPPWLAWKANNPLSKALAFGGRYSLHIYILHQPLFIGLIMLVSGRAPI